MLKFAFGVVARQGNLGRSRTGSFAVPPKVAELVRTGMELGQANDILFARRDSKKKDGASGILTGGIIDRASYYASSAILALIPFKNPDLYPWDTKMLR